MPQMRTGRGAALGYIAVGMNVNGVFANRQTSRVNIHQHRTEWSKLFEGYLTARTVSGIAYQGG